MKKRFLAGLVLTFVTLLCSHRAHAQATGISIDSIGAYTQYPCTLPAPTYINFAGFVPGTLTTLDSVTVDIDFGDGTDTSFNVGINQNFYWVYLSHTYLIPGVFASSITVSIGSFTDSDVTNSIPFSNSCAPLSGDLYVDANSNCVMDSGEDPLPYHTLTFSNGTSTWYAYTDHTGHYSVNLPTGATYSITPSTPGTLLPVCPSTGTASVTISSGTYVQDFAYSCNTFAAVDAGVTGWAIVWRPGQTRPLHIFASSNTYCNNVPATITATLPSDLSYSSTFSGSIAPSSVVGNVLTWNVASLGSLNSFMTTVYVACSATATLGDTLCVDVNIATTPADSNSSNNNYSVCAFVSNSYDPNDKAVSPKGNGTDGQIANGTRLTYLVNFQNTGNDVAYNVTIKDELDADLDLSSFKLIKASHAVTPFIVGNEVAFRFDNINLPDSGANEPGSHGFVLYSISPKANLPLGTQINNKADIYFDYNDPIITNTTVNIIANPSAVQHLNNGKMEASIFPNPANGYVHILVDDNKSFRATLFDLMGRTVSFSEGRGKASLSVRELPTGTYILKLNGEGNKVLSTTISVQH